MRLGLPAVQVESDLADDRLGDEYIHAIDACQIHSGDALQFIRKIEVGGYSCFVSSSFSEGDLPSLEAWSRRQN